MAAARCAGGVGGAGAPDRDIIVHLLKEEKREVVGFVRSSGDSSYSQIRNEINEDEIPGLSGIRWVFLGPANLAITEKQERYKCHESEVLIRVEQMQSSSGNHSGEAESVNLNIGASTNSDEPADFFRVGLHSKIATPKLTHEWKKAFRMNKKKLLDEKRDDQFELFSYDRDGAAVFGIFCYECNVVYGKGLKDSCYNFRVKHCCSPKHEENMKKRRSTSRGLELEEVAELGAELGVESEPAETGAETSEVAAAARRVEREELKADVERLFQEVVESFESDSNDPNIKFNIYEPSLCGFADKKTIHLECSFCGTRIKMFASGSLRNNLLQHVLSKKHQRGRDAAGEPGRPSKKQRRSEVALEKQGTLLSFVVKGKASASEQGAPQVQPSGSSRTSQSSSRKCHGFWQKVHVYGSQSYSLTPLLHDSKRGSHWYPDPHYEKKILAENGREVVINGTFWHDDCPGSVVCGNQCGRCASIPSYTDFRGRATRAEQSQFKRGERASLPGMRNDLMTTEERLEKSRLLGSQNRQLKMANFFLRKRSVALSIRNKSLRESLGESVIRKDVVKFCKDIVEAHKHGKFDGEESVWNLMLDIAQNLNRSKQGHRYHETTKQIFQVIRIWGGTRMYNFLRLNIKGPDITTTKRAMRQAFRYQTGINEDTFESLASIYQLKMQGLNLEFGSVPALVAEDETAIKRAVRWDTKHDVLLGFCGRKLEPHSCEDRFVVDVGEGEAGYTNVIEAFQQNTKASCARVFIANPLHVKLPSIVLGVLHTCNKFTAADVRRQWRKIQQLWDKHLLSVLGPLLGHSSDGDARRRACMLEDMLDSSNDYKLPWDGWCYSASVAEAGGIHKLHDQDFVHNGKKLINPLDRGSKTLFLGEHLAHLNDVWTVFERFHGDHGLQAGDVKRDDRQNWRAAQRIASRKVQELLRALRSPEVGRPERTLGTEVYLDMVASYIDIFLSPYKNLRERVQLAGKVSFFLRLWRLWITTEKKGTLKHNFISRESFLDVQLSCHFVVLLIRYFRDFHPNLPVPLAKTGSDVCENFFSKVGGMVQFERSYDGKDIMDSAGAMNQVALYEAEGDLRFARSHAKLENIWDQLEMKSVGGNVRADLGDFSGVASDQDIIQALAAGLQEAQQMCTAVGISCSSSSSATSWFTEPWRFEDFTGLPTESGAGPVQDESDEPFPASEDTESGVAEADAGFEDVELVARTELRHTLELMLDSHEEGSSSSSASERNISTNVCVDGKPVSKATLVSQLNGNPWLSKDRLTRVRNLVLEMEVEKNLNAATTLTVGSDCSLWFEEEVSTPATSKRSRVSKGKARTKLVWYIGRVLSIRRKFGNSWRDSRESLNMEDLPVYAKEGQLEFLFTYYREQEVDGEGKSWYSYDLHDDVRVGITSVIGLVPLSFHPDRGLYCLDRCSRSKLDEFISSNK